MLILRCMGVQIVDGFLYRGKGLALSGPVQPGLHEIMHVETGTRPFLRSFGEEWKLLPPDTMQLFHLFDAIPQTARAVLFRPLENTPFPVATREERKNVVWGERGAVSVNTESRQNKKTK